MTEVLVYTCEEAAKALKTDHETVATMLRRGEIPAYREGRNWKVPKTLLVAYAENRAIEEAKERKRQAQEEEK
ncbi:MAG: helix-turn-helix domain-containing protein [Bacillota bacterium]|nr:helix-turn-helix domain-containing protein [Bacillota bacterium]